MKNTFTLDRIPKDPAKDKLTKKQLAKPTYIGKLTIGDLNLDQLRFLLYTQMREMEEIDRRLKKAHTWLETCLP